MSMVFDVKRVSIISVEKVDVAEFKASKKWKEAQPRDKYYTVHSLFLLLGLMHFIPVSFFVTANAYWMYKFRNVDANETDTDSRTVLQTHFASGSTIVNILPSFIFILISAVIGHKLKSGTRVLWALITITVCFVIATLLVKINTDSLSIGSVESKDIAEFKASEKLKEAPPRDKYFIVHILVLLLGLMHFIPISFFVTANAYWMYKFRNVDANETDTDSRTALQTHFASGSTVANIIPTLIFILTSAVIGHKIKSRTRALWALTTITISYGIATIFVKINTDSWQVQLFVLVMALLTIINSCNAILHVGVLTILSKFPHHYMKVYLVGQSFAGIFTALLQIFSLAVGPSTTTAALIYFVAGTSLITFTLGLMYFIKFNHFYRHYNDSVVEATTRDLMPISDFIAIFKVIWPCVVTYIFITLTILPTHSAVTSLVVSEDYGNGNAWNDTYFVPVVTFLYSTLVDLGGRLVSSSMKQTINGLLLSVVMFVRMIILVPLIFLCNAQPRHYLPVLLPHDWEYIAVLGMLCFSNGFFFNMMYLDIGKLVPERVEEAYMVLVMSVSILGALLSPLSLFSVDLL